MNVDAHLAGRLFARDPAGTGLVLRAPPGPTRDHYLDLLRSLAGSRPFRRCPASVTEDRLWGALDLAATLASGRSAFACGLIAETDGGIVVLGSAERLSGERAARLGAVLDTGEVDGRTARVGLVLLDEGVEDEAPPASLLERCSFHVTLENDRGSAPGPARGGTPGPPILEALCATAASLGINSARATLLALRAAKGIALLEGRSTPIDEDAALAARLVLAPRATRRPETDSQTERQEDQAGAETDTTQERAAETDIVLEAAVAALPPGLLATRSRIARASGRAVAWRGIGLRGRPLAARPGRPGGGARLALIDTLRAAAPWQRVRPARRKVLQVRAGDLRVRWSEAKRRTTTLFVVDASGSAALHRLAEAKGAVELLLAECYVRRDQVAMISFRGSEASLLLPPTSALARARRALAALPGGGATPLAAGLDMALTLANGLARRSEQPYLVVLTDGRANVALDGVPDRTRAAADAGRVARLAAAARLPALIIDISPRAAREGPQGPARALAADMGGRFLALPQAGATALARAIRA